MRPGIGLLSLACLIGCAHEHETHERPSLAPPREAPLLVVPEGAFEPPTSEPSREASPPRSRFQTRRIHPVDDRRGRFGGARIDLDVKGADVHDVLRLVADVGKVNIVVAGEVSGTVTVRLKRVPWDQALDVIVRARGLAYEREGNVILVRAGSPEPGR